MTIALQRSGYLILMAVVLAGCASGNLIKRDTHISQTAAAADQTATVAQHIHVKGRHGRLNAAQRERLLRAIDTQGPGTDLNRHLIAQQQVVAPQLNTDGQARLLSDGPATFDAMFSAIALARHSVLLESYIIDDAAVAVHLADLLKRKRAEGVQVAVIYDDVGSFSTDSDYFKSLRDGGIPTCAFNPLLFKRRLTYWNMAHRDHRKILVVDGQVAFTGGINISAVYGSGSFSGSVKAGHQRKGWRDTQVELIGPVAGELEALVRATWQDQQCEPALPLAIRTPQATDTGSATQHPLIAILPSNPTDDFNRIYAMLLTAIDVSRHSVWFTMAYFTPTNDMLNALADAARRGVDVRLILPAHSDFAPVHLAGRSHYTKLLKAGVKLYELQDSILHAKTVVIDGVLSSVGSSNLDWRSFVGNNEANAVIFGEAFGQSMQAMFQRDLRDCRAITLETWRKRPLWQKTKETAAGLFERLW